MPFPWLAAVLLSLAPAPAPSLQFQGLSTTVTAGVSVTFDLQALDAAGSQDKGYLGTVSFESTDPYAELPRPTTFSSTESGLKRGLSLRLWTPGTHRVLARDGRSPEALGEVTVIVPASTAPALIREANPVAAVGVPYRFSDLGRARAVGDPDLTFSSCGSADGFRVDLYSGAIRWTPTTTGTASLCIKVQNGKGSDSYPFTVQVGAPSGATVRPSFTATPSLGAAPMRVVFDASASMTGTSGAATRFLWDFGDGSAPGTGVSPAHVYALSGGYRVRLTAFDDTGVSGTAFRELQVKDASGRLPPVARVVATLTQTTYPYSIELSCDCTTGDAPLTTYAWEFGDGRTSDAATTAAAFVAGRYWIRLTVHDQNGASATDVTELVVPDEGHVPPECRAWAEPPAGPAPLAFTWRGELSAEGTATSVTWKINGLTVRNKASGTATCDASKVCEAQLTVTDAAGRTCSDTARVRAFDPQAHVAPAIVSAPSTTVFCENAYHYGRNDAAVASGGGVTWSAEGAPDGFAIDATTGRVTWTPTRAQGGVHPVVLVATNSAGTARQEVRIDVDCDERKLIACAATETSGAPWPLALAVAAVLFGRARAARGRRG